MVKRRPKHYKKRWIYRWMKEQRSLRKQAYRKYIESITPAPRDILRSLENYTGMLSPGKGFNLRLRAITHK